MAAGMSMPLLVGLLAIWFLIGVGSFFVQTPGGRLLRRSAHEEDRPALFAAQFALSHACWLVTYLVAGVVGNEIGLFWTFGLLVCSSWYRVAVRCGYGRPSIPRPRARARALAARASAHT
jgi:hypothetical protein